MAAKIPALERMRLSMSACVITIPSRPSWEGTRANCLPSVPSVSRLSFSDEALLKAEEIAGRMTYFDLMTHPTYMDEFVKANFLPHTDMSRFPSVVPQGSSSRGKPFGVSGGGEG